MMKSSTPQIITLKTRVLFQNFNDHPLRPLPGKDVRFPGFTGELSSSFPIDSMSCKEQFYEETVRAGGFVLLECIGGRNHPYFYRAYPRVTVTNHLFYKR